MYRVMLVDDEDLEREGMAALVPWNEMGMELTDMAWNGIEALEKLKAGRPDIVITDIKMPVMDGLELIRRARELYPEMEFVILSGYGEFDYTSQAMEYGIRHYILKPCDEERLVETLRKVCQSLDERRAQESTDKEYRSTLQRALPHAKEQILSALISLRQLSPSDELLLRQFMKGKEGQCLLYGLRAEEELDQLDRFALGNILTELLGEEQILLSSGSPGESLFLLPASLEAGMVSLMRKVHREFARYRAVKLTSAVSEPGEIQDTYRMYAQLRELFAKGAREGHQEFLSRALWENPPEDALRLLDYRGLRNAVSFPEVLFELYTARAKMGLDGFSLEQMQESLADALLLVYEIADFGAQAVSSEPELWRRAAQSCRDRLPGARKQEEQDRRMEPVLFAVYENIRNPELSLQYLAREILFMNEDYLGRLFSRNMKEKYSAFLVETRMRMAQRLLDYDPEIRISDLAEQVGYAPDGQYFAKAFRKYTGMTPSDYRRGRLQTE